MRCLILILISAISFETYSQTYVFDERHFAIVNANGVMRNISEIGYHRSLEIINNNTDDIGLNSASLALVNTMILNSLTQVNEGLKDAIQVKNIGKTILHINEVSTEVYDIAQQNPILLLFAEEYILQAKTRGLNLVTEVSSFILKESNEVLINYNVRDQLLDTVQTELQVILAYMIAVRNSMYWANVNGVIKMLNPYQDFINRDLALSNQIIQKRKSLQ
tara:strand:+ start:2671 stop:3330 length:660 start_codon:yes stop_codon:yes gene_type:complete